MTLEHWALGAVVVYGIGVLTGLAIRRRLYGAERASQQMLSGPSNPLPAATTRGIRRAERKRRLRLGLTGR